jgi:hypothetical protein
MFSRDELEDCLAAMEMFSLQMSLPWDKRGPGDWAVWHCTAECAGRLAATVRHLERDAERYRFLRNQPGMPTPEEFDAAIDADRAADDSSAGTPDGA